MKILTPPTRPSMSRSAIYAVTGLWIVAVAGCGDAHPPLAPVEGRVLLDGTPLTFGSVMFQPAGGKPATGTIQPDGSFSLSTYEPNDGAAIGKHRVRITCYEGQRPGVQQDSQEEMQLGRLLIPKKYTNIHTSELQVDVQPENAPIVIELESP